MWLEYRLLKIFFMRIGHMVCDDFMSCVQLIKTVLSIGVIDSPVFWHGRDNMTDYPNLHASQASQGHEFYVLSFCICQFTNWKIT